MILLNLTDEILENAKKEGWEVVEVEMGRTQRTEEVAAEADLIQQAAQTMKSGSASSNFRIGRITRGPLALLVKRMTPARDSGSK